MKMYGEKNKFVRHTFTGVPEDLFDATDENWWNYLVCRTRGAESNATIAAAKEHGYRWNPYGSGFIRLSDQTVIPMDSEEAVFRFFGLPYLSPSEQK